MERNFQQNPGIIHCQENGMIFVNFIWAEINL